MFLSKIYKVLTLRLPNKEVIGNYLFLTLLVLYLIFIDLVSIIRYIMKGFDDLILERNFNGFCILFFFLCKILIIKIRILELIINYFFLGFKIFKFTLKIVSIKIRNYSKIPFGNNFNSNFRIEDKLKTTAIKIYQNL